MDRSAIILITVIALLVLGGWLLVGMSLSEPARRPARPVTAQTFESIPGQPAGALASSFGQPPAPRPPGTMPALAMPVVAKPGAPALPTPPGAHPPTGNIGDARITVDYRQLSFSALAQRLQADAGLVIVRDQSQPEPTSLTVSVKDAPLSDLYDAIGKQIGLPWQGYGLGGAAFGKPASDNHAPPPMSLPR